MSSTDGHPASRTIGGRFEVGARKGSGVEVATFEGVDRETDEPVVLKLVHPTICEDTTFRLRFSEVMGRTAELHHPNLARVLQYGADVWNGRPMLYVASEHLGGGSLRDLLDRGRLLSASQALMVGLEACKGLDALHRAGEVHGDIRPATLIFGDDSRLRVADAGLSRLIGDLVWAPGSQPTQERAGYASPERALGEEVGPTSDVYSLALAMLESATGRLPFVGDSAVATLANRVDRLLPVSADLGPLAAALERAARPDPADRVGAAAFGAALLQAAQRMPRPAPMPTLAGGWFADGGTGIDPSGPLPRPEPEIAERTPSGGTRRPAGPGREGTPSGGMRRPRPDRSGTPSGGARRPPEAERPGRPARRRPAPSDALRPGEVSRPAVPAESSAPSPTDPLMSRRPAPAETEPTAGPPDSPATPEPVAVAEPPAHPEPAVATADATASADPAASAAEPVDPAPAAPPATPATPAEPVAPTPAAAEAPPIAVPRGGAIAGPVVRPPAAAAVTRPMPRQAAPVVVEQQAVFDQGRRRSWWWLAVPLVLLVLAGGGLAAYWKLHTVKHDVPKLAGLSVQEATAAVAPLDFRLAVTRSTDEQVPIGQIVSSDPVEGVALKEGSTIAVVVSSGPAPRRVPSLIGSTIAAASAELEADSLQAVRDADVFDEQIPAGAVVSFTVEGQPAAKAGDDVPRGSTIHLVISKGPKPRKTPRLVGSTPDDATTVLEQLDLVLDVKGEEYSSTVAKGAIVSQVPDPNVEVPRGATISVVVSKGPELVTVPDVTGMNPSQILTALRDAGMTVDVLGSTGDFTQRLLSLTAGDRVVQAGDQVPRGTRLTMHFATATPPTA